MSMGFLKTLWAAVIGRLDCCIFADSQPATTVLIVGAGKLLPATVD